MVDVPADVEFDDEHATTTAASTAAIRRIYRSTSTSHHVSPNGSYTLAERIPGSRFAGPSPVAPAAMARSYVLSTVETYRRSPTRGIRTTSRSAASGCSPISTIVSPMRILAWPIPPLGVG